MCGSLSEDKPEDGIHQDNQAVELVHNVSYKGSDFIKMGANTRLKSEILHEDDRAC
jgi:hypothetical protein